MKTIEQLKWMASKIDGPLWHPDFNVEQLSYADHVSPELRGWYWFDRNEIPSDQWRGPFKSEGKAWEDIVMSNGIDPNYEEPADSNDRTQHEEAKDNALRLAQQALEEASKALERGGVSDNTRALVRSALIEVNAVIGSE